ncbi:ATP-grasp domain-containing protein [Planomonospora corallina]|uniref:ATP-grasp domain-containing protein n=1 Tax=Planomonospora corallina TaxID=1806052 RepID=A0ABV8IEV5_9ACTN
MKLLALEARQNGAYYQSRYRQVADLGAELYVLNGIGTPDFWPEDRYRIAGSQHIDDLVTAAKAWHEQERFDGIITFSESAVTAVAVVAEALGLPGVGPEAARTSRNKLLMRRAHLGHGAPHPDFRLVADVEEARRAAEDFGYPVILKPTLGAASNFVFRIDDEEELRRTFPQAAEGIEGMSWFGMEAEGIDLGPHGLMVESFLDGEEFLIEAVVWDGEVYLGSVVDRITAEGGTFDDDVHHAPTSLGPEQVAAVHRVVTAGARAQGLRRSVLHAEVRFHRGEPYLLEIAIRPGGGGLDLIARITADHCPIRAVMDVACGRRPRVRHYAPTGVHVTAMCLLCEAGRIERIEVPAEVSESDRVFFLKVTAKPGDVVRRPPEGNSILGFLGTTGDSLEDARQVMNDLADRIRVDLTPIGDPR